MQGGRTVPVQWEAIRLAFYCKPEYTVDGAATAATSARRVGEHGCTGVGTVPMRTVIVIKNADKK